MNNTDEVSTPPFPPLPHPLACQINQINHSDFLILAFARFLLLSYNMYLCSGWVLITLALVFQHSVKIPVPVFGVGSNYFGFSFSTLSQNMLHNIRSQNTQQS